MRTLLRLALILIATTCASRAFAAGPHVFDPDGPRPVRPTRPAPTAIPRAQVAPAPVLAATTRRSRMPAPVPRPAPSVNLEPPPPPGMGILRHMMHGVLRNPSPLDKRRGARPNNEEGYVL